MNWVDRFARARGRAPRVLHIGNVGNNAYLNGRFLRAAGVDCHVLSYDYYDRLATPEWEGHSRPPWFVQGPLPLSVSYLLARLGGDERRRRMLARRLRLSRTIPPRLRYAVRGARIRGAAVKDAVREASRSDVEPGDDEVAPYRSGLGFWERLFPHYDVVQAYATDPIWPYFAGVRPYVAYEHGTLRHLADDDDPFSRLTARAYAESDHTFVTNGDCLEPARRIGVASLSPMIHPLDVDAHRSAIPARRPRDADVVLFCPMRHDWAVKGTDVHIRALPKLLTRLRPKVVLVLCEWGSDVERSRALVHDLGCSENVVWLPLLRRLDLIAHMKGADVVLDQMTLPHFDATVPQALAAGCPVVMSYRPESTEWIVDEPAPILSAFDEDGVVEATLTALDPAWRASFSPRAHGWIEREHHPRRLVDEHLRVYELVFDGGSRAAA